MHVVEKISSLLNIDPQNSSELLLEFYPLPFDKYITIYNEMSVPSNFYDYFNDIIDDIFPFLQKNNIHIVQLLNSPSDTKIKNSYCIDKFSYSQVNFLIKNSLLHICTDAYTNEIAGIFNKNLIFLIGNRFPKSSKSWFCNNKNTHIFSELAFKKPTFSLHEFPKSINKIKTEDISEKILNILGFNDFIKYKTLFTGSKYHEKAECDYIPNFILNNEVYSKFSLNIRLDKFFSLENCANFCSKYEHNILTNKKIPKDFIKFIKNKCKKIVFLINSNTQEEDLLDIINSGIQLELIYENNIFNKDLAFKFLDFGKINIINNEINQSDYKKFDNKSFKTSKLILSNNKKYPSYAHLEKDIQISTINKCINSPLFWEYDSRYKIIGD